MMRMAEPSLHVQTEKQARLERFLVSPADDRDTILQHFLQRFKTPDLAATIGDALAHAIYRDADPIGEFDRLVHEVQLLADNLKLVRAKYESWVDPSGG
jgi:hypothetical protein